MQRVYSQALQRGQSVSVYLFPCPCYFIIFLINSCIHRFPFNTYLCYVMVILVLVFSVA